VPIEDEEGFITFVEEGLESKADEDNNIGQGEKVATRRAKGSTKKLKVRYCRWCGKPTGKRSVYCNKQHKLKWLRNRNKERAAKKKSG